MHIVNRSTVKPNTWSGYIYYVVFLLLIIILCFITNILIEVKRYTSVYEVGLDGTLCTEI